MRNFFFLTHCIFISLLAFANNGDYAASKISSSLLKNANAVLRLEEVRFEVVSTKEAIERNHYVITILNEKGDDWADFSEYYDKLREISYIEGFLYDANGKELKKVKSKDLQDYSGTGESLMEDVRFKHHNFYYRAYPYTIEYDVEIRYNHTMFFPVWMPQGREKLSVEQSRFTIVCPSDYQFRFKAFNYRGDPQVATEKSRRLTTWVAQDLPAMVKEEFSPDWQELATAVITGPTIFQLGDYKGDMTTWKNLGKFQHTLNEGRDKLPEDVKLQVHQLVDGVPDVKKKIELLYQYLQKNTRYISVQLGIGGWQPFDASYVATKGYGDCKALTNYMRSLLLEIGIHSNYTLIKAGANENYLTSDFPSRQFNHAILSVPLGRDTMWLECTSQDLAAGYLSAFTADRYGLAVDDSGGALVRTPKYGLKDNLQSRSVKALLDDEASLQVEVNTRYTGLEQDLAHDLINYLSKDKVKEYLQKTLDFPTYDLDKFAYTEHKARVPELTERLSLHVSNYASITGRRLFIVPNVMTRSDVKLKSDEERKYPIVLNDEYSRIDSVEIDIPKGYTIESIAQPAKIETQFGKYSSTIKLVENKIFYYRIEEQYSGTFPASDYKGLVNYYETIYKADRNRVVLVKKDSN